MEIAVYRRRLSGNGHRRALLAGLFFSADVRPKAGKRARREDGQALIEFAIVLPLLLIVITGIIQFGLMLNRYITLTDAVRSGARELALQRNENDPCDPAVLQTVKSASAIGLASSQVTPSFSSSGDYCGTGTYVYNTSGNTGGNENGGDQATVTATQPFTLNVFGMGVITVNLKASASDAIE